VYRPAIVSAPELRPLGVGEIFDIAINVYRRHAGTLLRLVFFVVAPVSVVAAIVQGSAVPEDDDFFRIEDDGTLSYSESEVWATVAATLIAVLLGFIATTVASGACFRAVADAYLGSRPDWRESLGFAVRRLHSILWVTVLGSLLAIVGLVFCVIPGVYLYVAFAVAVPVLLTEGIKGRKALGRSRQLVKGRWWPTFAVVVLGTILAGIVSSVLEGLAAAVSLTNDDPGSLVSIVAAAVSATAANTITVPFISAFVIVLYFDLRVRKEAFDLQLLAQQVGVDPVGGIPAAPTRMPEPEAPSEQPPFWPPPPGWKPGGQGE
jgi:hypothetical protein